MLILTQYPIDIALIELTDDAVENLMFIQALRKAPANAGRELPVMVMMRKMESAMLERACGYGIHGLVKKPLSGEAMVKAVDAVLAKPTRIVLPRRSPPPSPPPVQSAAEADRPAEPHPRSAGPHPARAAAARPGVAGSSAARPASPGGSGSAAGPAVAPVPPRTGGAIGLEVAGLPSAMTSSGGLEVLETPARRDDGELGFETVEAAAKAKKQSAPLEARGKPAVEQTIGIETVGPAKAGKPAEETPSINLEEILAAHQAWVNSRGQDGKRAILQGADLSARDLVEVQLNSADLRGADLSSSDLSGAHLHGADLREAEMMGANLTGSNLAVSRLRRARLIGCSVDGANLKGADLAGADLSGSKFADADLTGAILLGAVLTGADLSAAKGLSRSQLEAVTGDAKTRLPPGLSLPKES